VTVYLGLGETDVKL